MHRVGICLKQLVSPAVVACAIVTMCAGLTCPVCAQCETLAIEPPDPANKELFGGNVAIDGDLLAVADPWFNESRGAVYIYRRIDGEWTLLHSIDDEPLSFSADFGRSMDLDDDLLVVGAESNENDDAPLGTVFIYRIGATEVVREAVLTGFYAERGEPSNGVWYGRSVAVSNQRVAVGWPTFAESGGRIEIYEQGRDGTWVLRNIAAAGIPDSNQRIGTRVSLCGDVLMSGSATLDQVAIHRFNGTHWAEEHVFGPVSGIGLEFDLRNGVAVVGAPSVNRVFVSQLNQAVWSDLNEVSTDTTTGPDPDFGASVALSEDGTVLLVGARTDQADGFHSGAAHVFRLSEGDWVEQAKLTPENGGPENQFGFNVALSEDSAAISAYTTAHLFEGLAGVDLDNNGIPDVCELPADLDGDGEVDIADLIQLLASWGPCGSSCVADLDSDGVVGFSDLLLILGGWT